MVALAVGIRPVGHSAASAAPYRPLLSHNRQAASARPAFRTVGRVPSAGIPTAFIATNDIIWLALRSRALNKPGTVIGFDSRTGVIRAKLEVGAVPTALAAFGNALWVANGTIPTPSRVLKAGTIERFGRESDGRWHETRTLAAREPLALTATEAGVWLISSAGKTGQPIQLEAMKSGRLRRIAHLDATVADATSGTGPVLISCAGRIAVVAMSNNGNSTTLESFAPGGHMVSRRLFRMGGIATLACVGTRQLIVAISNRDSGGLFCVPASPTCRRRFGDPELAAAAGFGSDVVGIDVAQYGNTAGVNAYDLTNGQAIWRVRVPTPGDVRLAVGGNRLFVLDNRSILVATRR